MRCTTVWSCCSGFSGCAGSYRRIFDDVWTQFAKLSSPLGSQLDDDLKAGRLAGSPPDFDPSGAPTTSTRVLVVGATGRCALPARSRSALALPRPWMARLDQLDSNSSVATHCTSAGSDKLQRACHNPSPWFALKESPAIPAGESFARPVQGQAAFLHRG